MIDFTFLTFTFTLFTLTPYVVVQERFVITEISLILSWVYFPSFHSACKETGISQFQFIVFLFCDLVSYAILVLMSMSGLIKQFSTPKRDILVWKYFEAEAQADTTKKG